MHGRQGRALLGKPQKSGQSSFFFLLHLSQKEREGRRWVVCVKVPVIWSVSVITRALPTLEAKATQGSSKNTGQEYSPIQHS